MIIFLVILYVFVCILLTVIILLQPSEGGGVSQTLGGGQIQTILGTKTTTFLIKTTAVLAIIFLGICLLLAVLSSKKERSLMESRAAVEIEKSVATKQIEPKVAEGPQSDKAVTPAPLETGQATAQPQTAPEAAMPVEPTTSSGE